MRALVVLTALAAIIAGSPAAMAQPQPPALLWERTYQRPGAQGAYDAIELDGEGFLLAGETWSEDGNIGRPYLLRIAENGDILWTRTFELPGGNSEAVAITRGIGGGLVLAGSLYWADSLRFVLMWTDSDGVLDHWRVYGGPNSIVQDLVALSDGYVLCGRRTPTGTMVQKQMYIVRTNLNGDTLWTSFIEWPSSVQTEGNRILPTADGGFLAVGGQTISTPTPPPTTSAYLVRLDANGDTLWTKTYGNGYFTDALAVCPIGDQGYLVVVEIVEEDVWLPYIGILRIDAAGDTLWSKIYSADGGKQAASDVIACDDGGFMLAGYNEPAVSDQRFAFLMRIDSNGDTLWTCSYGSSPLNWANSVRGTADGGYLIIGGANRISPSSTDVYALRLEPELSSRETIVPVPARSALQVSPNPFNTMTQIEFTLPSTQRMSLRLYDVLGREVAVMMNEIQTAGRHEMMFDASGLPSGVYLCRLEAGGMAQTRKMVLVK
jgi:hypothetical protein